MKHEEKVCFLFDQTIKTIINRRGSGATPNHIEFHFDEYYKVLEKLLNEKLDEK